jgi:hypothetical protein
MADEWHSFAGPETDALAAGRLRNRRQRLNERARFDYVADAEEEWRRRHGRPMTTQELERVLRRYPGDL